DVFLHAEAGREPMPMGEVAECVPLVHRGPIAEGEDRISPPVADARQNARHVLAGCDVKSALFDAEWPESFDDRPVDPVAIEMLERGDAAQASHPSRAGRDGLEKLGLLGNDLGAWAERKARDVPPGTPEALDQAMHYRVRDAPEDDGNRPSRSCRGDRR